MMGEPTSFEPVFLENLALIERVAAVLARRHSLRGEEAADFASWIKLKLIENDYAAFRKFRGESTMGTYLTVVISMLARDYRVQRWGRWRPSAAARRRGDLAVRLESLVQRRGYRVEEAGELLRTSGETTLSDRQLHIMLSELPERTPLRPVEVGAAPLDDVESGVTADVLVATSSVEQERAGATQALERALNELPVEDRVIVRMRFWEGLTVAEIARALTVEQKPLYRRIDRILSNLAGRLTALGLGRKEARALLDEAVS